MGKFADLFVNIGANTSDFQKGINNIQKGSSALGNTLKSVGGIVAGAFAVERIGAFVSEVSQLAQVAEGVEMAFKRIGGYAYLDDLRKATKGTVSDLELMKAAVQAKNFDIPLQQLGSLLAFAHQRAKDTGQSVDYLVNSIVVGIGRKSPLILDNLGISAVALKEKMKGVGTETASVGDVAKAVGEIASDAMAKVGESADTTAEKTARVKTEWTNFKVALGEFVNKIVGVLAPVLTEVIGSISFAFQAMGNAAGYAAEQVAMIFEKVNGQAVNNGVKYVDELSAKLQKNGRNKPDADKKAFELYKGEIESTIKTYQEKLKSTDESIRKNAKYQISVLQLELDGVSKVLADREKITALGAQDLKNTEDKTKFLSEWGKTDYSAESRVYSEDAQYKGVPGMTPISGKIASPEVDHSGIQSLGNAYEETAKQITEATLEMSGAISQFAEDFAVGIGELISGSASFTDFGKTILMAVGNFMASLGRQLIAIGMAGIAAKMLAKNPYMAVAAGIALLALSSAATSSLSSNPMSGGAHSVSAGTYSGMSSNRNMQVEIVGVVKGTDIYWSQKRLEKQLNNTTSRG